MHAYPDLSAGPEGLPSTEQFRREVAGLAYRFYVERGRCDGHDLEDWLRAEREVLDRLRRTAEVASEPVEGGRSLAASIVAAAGKGLSLISPKRSGRRSARTSGGEARELTGGTAMNSRTRRKGRGKAKSIDTSIA